jgi:hypothetical protein
MRLIKTLITLFIGFYSIVALAQPHPDRHSTSITDAWLSCTASSSPNPARGTGHWLRIDLGDTYALQGSRIWNFNTPERINSYNGASWSIQPPLPGKLTDGLKDIVIDLSIDGVTWKEWGRFTLPMADASGFYSGAIGPNFDGIITRHILITAQSNYGGSCYGLGELKVFGNIATISTTIDPLEKAEMSVQPNPVVENAQVILQNFPAGKTILTFRDIMGREITRQEVDINDGTYQYTFKSQDLANGLYFLTATSSGSAKTIKIEILK